MKTKYIIILDQDADVDYSEDIKEDLESGIINGHAKIKTVELIEENHKTRH